MAHCISGLVAEAGRLERIAASLDLPPPAPLQQGLAFLPVDSEEVARITGSSEKPVIDDEYQGLEPSFVALVTSLSAEGPIVYLCTEYFGGMGGQGAMLADGGAIRFGPDHASGGSINAALRGLGVTVKHDVDAFSAIGLGAHRWNAGWRKADAAR